MKKLVILTGPTAVGKSALSISLAKKINGEIISADSMQVYKGMDIGSAKITKDEMCGIKHHLIDVLEPTDNFDITLFKSMSLKAIDDIYSRGSIPIICGGTGFYIQSLLYDIEFSEEDSVEKESIRNELEDYVSKYGNDALHEKLKDIDLVSYNNIPSNNVKRVIRAIEFYRLHNYPISKHNEEQHEKESNFDFAYIVINDDREKLYKRIDSRVDKMLTDGLLEEVSAIRKLGVNKDNTSYNGIGYREIFDYFDNLCTLDEAIENIKKNSRHYAKRQLTWFRREKCVNWIDRNELKSDELILERILLLLKEKGII